MTIASLLNAGKDYLRGRETACLDSEVVLAHVLGVEKEYLFAHGNLEVEDTLINLFYKYLGRVKNGEPVSYITNSKEFFGLDFFVDKRVFVPRSETEMLVEEALNYLKKIAASGCCKRGLSVLDVGTGSGNIVVSIAKNVGEEDLFDRIDAVDISEEALDVARINIEQHGVGSKVHVFQSDLLDVIAEGDFYDVILANLPYIGDGKSKIVDEKVERYEPKSSLFGGDDGLKLYKKMFQQIKEKNIGFGIFLGEFGFGQRKDLEVLLNKYFDHDWCVKSDLAGIDRMFAVED